MKNVKRYVFSALLIGFGISIINAGFLESLKTKIKAITQNVTGSADKKETLHEIEPIKPINNPDGLQVLSVSPSGHVKDTGGTTSITVTFEKPMVALTALPPEDTPGPLILRPVMKGKYRWLGTNTLVFTPETGFQKATRYLATIPKGTKAYDGTELISDYAWTFETIRPELLNSMPRHGQTFVDIKEHVILLFNQEVSPDRMSDFIELVGKPNPSDAVLERKIYPYDKSEYTKRFKVKLRELSKEKFEKIPRYYRYNIIQEFCAVVEPVKPLNREFTYTLILKEGLPAAQGNLGLLKERHIQFKTYNLFRILEVQEKLHLQEGLNIVFSNPVIGKELAKALSFNPDIKLPDYLKDSTYVTQNYYITADFKPKQKYRIIIDNTLKDKFEQKLSKPWERDVQVTSYVPQVSMPKTNLTVESGIKHRLPVTVINVKSMQKLLSPVTPQEAIAQLLKPRIFSWKDNWINIQSKPLQTWKINKKLDQRAILALELDEVLNRKGYGFLFANVRLHEPDNRSGEYALSFLTKRNSGYVPYVHKAFVQVTNLGITAKCSAENNLIWITYLDSAKPVPGAKIELYTDSSEMVWNGKTDKNGLVITPGWAFLNMSQTLPHRYYYGNPRLWIVAKKDSDTAMSASNWGTGIYPYTFGIQYKARQTYPEYAGHVYTERGLYRAGETVYIKGLFRQKRMGEWVISDIKDVELQIKNARNEEIFKKQFTVNEFGSFNTDFILDSYAVTGTYFISVVDGGSEDPKGFNKLIKRRKNKFKFSTSFKVEAFIPAKFEVTAQLSKDSYMYGEKTNGWIRGWYLFGAPMKKAKVTWRAHLWEKNFMPEGYPGYSFGPKKYLGEYKKEHRGSVLVASGENKLNNQGELHIKTPLRADALLGSMVLQLEGTVTDKDRQFLSGRKTAIVHPGEYYIGIKPSTTFTAKNKEIKISVITPNPEGTLIGDNNVELQVIRREWQSVRKAGIHGRTSWVTEKKDTVIKKFQIITSTSVVEVIYKPEKGGYYILHAVSQDSHKRKLYSDAYFYVTGRDYVAWARSDDDKIDLVADQVTYKPGETARVMVKSPYEKALALVSIEREMVLHQFITEVVGSADVIEIPLKENHVPNIYVSVVLLQGRTTDRIFSEEGDDLGKPSFKIGYVNLPVDPGTKHLQVNVKVNRKEFRPRGKARVTFQVNDSNGKPRIAECSIAVVDRGVLDLIGYKTPNSFDHFYGQRPLSVETVESRLHVLGQRNYGEKGENRGGGGAGMRAGLFSEVDLRGLFKATVYWDARIITDADGKGTVTFNLPDNLTTFKVMVTAHTKNAHFGAGEAEFKVKKPLMIKPSLPRFARLDDIFQAGIVIHNQTGKKGRVRIEVDTEGIKIDGVKNQEIFLDAGKAQEVKFEFIANKIGKAVFQFAAKLDDETDGLEWELPVIMPRMTEVVALYEHTDNKATQSLKIPKNIYTEIGGLHLEAASTALLGLKEGIKYLEEYPYECLEQKISRILPFLLANDVLEAFKISELKGVPRKEAVNTLLKDIVKFQLNSGGFSYWPSGWIPCEYLSAYAMFFLHAAHENGFKIDQKIIDKSISYLQSILRRKDEEIWSYPYNRSAQLCTKSFIVYVLALWDEGEPAYVNRLYNNRFQIPLFGKTLLLKAIHHGNMGKKMEDELIRDLYNGIKIDPTKAHFEEQDTTGLDWIYYSAVRTTAFVLQAMMEINRDFPQAAKIIRWLMDERKIGRWRSTQENIYVFYALAEYFRRYEKEEPHFTATITLGAKEALKHLFKGRNIQAEIKTIPWNEFTPDEEITATMTKDGTGRLYYGLRMIYAPKGIVKAREEGLKVERKITLVDGSPLPKVIKVGTKLVVSLTVTTPFDRTYIAVEDSLPAAFQPLNTSFKTAGGEDIKTLHDAESKNRRWWGSFNYREFYDERVVIFAEYLTQGSHTAHYMVTAITPGTFSFPPAKAEGMYTPEVFGRTSSSVIEVR